MLAPHRDRENLVHGHQMAAKQPKTPGPGYFKTPLKRSENDENAMTVHNGKTGLGGASRVGGNDKLMTKGKGASQALMTPLDNKTRAPLGNKTTNAKARNGGTVGVKDVVREIEKSQVKPTTSQKPKQRSAGVAPIKFEVKPDLAKQSEEDEEPEYAPPAPEPLPYESDCFPNTLTYEGLKKENLMRGFYQHFINPVDENGVSRKDREFEAEMEAVHRKAEEQNARDLASITWSNLDLSDSEDSQPTKKAPLTAKAPATKNTARGHQTATINSRKAASALSMSSDRGTKAASISRPATATRRPLSSLIKTNKPTAKPAVARPAAATAAPGEMASRTTLGYNKGRSASSLVHSRSKSEASRPGRAAMKPLQSSNDEGNLTITPARAREAASKIDAPIGNQSRPKFMTIFDTEEDDEEDIPQVQMPEGFSLDEEDEEFELKLPD